MAPRTVALALSVAITIAACSSESDADPDQTASTTTTTTPLAPASDGVLKIGVMLPPAATLLRDPISNGVHDAIDQVNAAGGVFGRQVMLVESEEGDSATTGANAVQELLAADVDAIVGPASSSIALSTLSSIVANDVVACSPTASALSLDNFPDDGLFFRTVPSDSTQAKAIAQIADQTGVQSAVVVYVDDGFGRPLSTAIDAALAAVPIEVADVIPFTSGATDLADVVDRVAASPAQILILLAGSNDGTQFLEALSDAGTSNLASIIVNDALRSAESAQRVAALPAATRNKITGVAPQAESNDPSTPFDPPGPFATQAFDCVTLIALAAADANSDVGSNIAAQLPGISVGGQTCRTYLECSEALATLSIDYDGPSGLTDIGGSGDPSRARFYTFEFDDEGHDVAAVTFNVDA